LTFRRPRRDPSPMASGAVTLGDLARYLAMLDVACRKCERRSRYKVSGLVAKYGPELALPDLRGILAADCPRMTSGSIYERCGINFPHLPASM
jgi:hypothetical protein